MSDLTEQERARARLMQSAGVPVIGRPAHDEPPAPRPEPPTLEQISAVVTERLVLVIGGVVLAFVVLLLIIALAGGVQIHFGSA